MSVTTSYFLKFSQYFSSGLLSQFFRRLESGEKSWQNVRLPSRVEEHKIAKVEEGALEVLTWLKKMNKGRQDGDGQDSSRRGEDAVKRMTGRALLDLPMLKKMVSRLNLRKHVLPGSVEYKELDTIVKRFTDLLPDFSKFAQLSVYEFEMSVDIEQDILGGDDDDEGGGGGNGEKGSGGKDKGKVNVKRGDSLTDIKREIEEAERVDSLVHMRKKQKEEDKKGVLTDSVREVEDLADDLETLEIEKHGDETGEGGVQKEKKIVKIGGHDGAGLEVDESVLRERKFIGIESMVDYHTTCLEVVLFILMFAEVLRQEDKYKANMGEAYKLASSFCNVSLPLIQKVLSKEKVPGTGENVYSAKVLQKSCADLPKDVVGIILRRIILKLARLDDLFGVVDIMIFPRSFTAHGAGVKSISVCNTDPSFILTAGYDRLVRIWDLNTRRCLAQFAGHRSIVPRAVINSSDEYVVSCSFDGTVRVWHSHSGECLHVLTGHEDSVMDVAMSTYNERLVASCSMDKTCRLWDRETGVCLRVLKGHKKWVKTVSLTHDGKYLLSCSLDKHVIVWDIQRDPPPPEKEEKSQTGSRLLQVNVGGANERSKRRSLIESEREGRDVADAGGSSVLRSSRREGGEDGGAEGVSERGVGASEKKDAQKSEMKEKPKKGGVRDRVRDEKGGGGEDGHTQGSAAGFDFVAHDDFILCSQVSSKNVLATSSRDRCVRLWDPKDGHLFTTIDDHPSCASTLSFSKDGKVLAAGSFDNFILLYNAETGALHRQLRVFNEGVVCVCLHSDINALLIGANDGSVQVIPL